MWTGDFIEGRSWGECKSSAQVEYQLPPRPRLLHTPRSLRTPRCLQTTLFLHVEQGLHTPPR